MALSEFELIDRFFRRPAPHAILGVGDDAALLAPTLGCELVASVDMLIEGTHFLPDAEPEALGHKTLAVNLSDIAAMGARPRWALLACALLEADPAWLASFARGFLALADAYGVELVGGDTTRGQLALCVTILGEAPSGRALRRSGARAGDAIYVSGRLGDAALAVAHHAGRVVLTPAERAYCELALTRPTPRIALGERLRGLAGVSTTRTGSPATWATSSTRRASARPSISRCCRARPRSTRGSRGRSAHSRSIACSRAATITSCSSPRRRAPRLHCRRSRPSSSSP